MKSYMQPYTGVSRASFVDAVVPTLAPPKTILRFFGDRAAGPRFVLTTGGRVIVVGDEHVWAAGGKAGALDTLQRGPMFEPWTGEMLSFSALPARVLGWSRVGDVGRLVIVQQNADPGAHTIDTLVIRTNNDSPPSSDSRVFHSIGVAAASARGTTVAAFVDLASSTGGSPRAVLLDPARRVGGVVKALGKPRVVVERPFSEGSTYDVSATASGFAVLSLSSGASIDPTLSMEDMDTAQQWRRRARGQLHSLASWASRVTMLDEKLDELWHVDAPVAAKQPPIDGGDGRIYLVGDSVALVREGKFLWVKDWPGQATAARDGMLVHVHDKTLRVIDDSGRERQLLYIDEGPIKTPPAIAEDGSVYFATAGKVWRAAPL
ncbi:MAG: hypothetical protein R3B72_28055 [Polyangiaceae bacterium]